MSTALEKTTELEIAVVDEQTIKDKIYNIRGQQVMLDFDLAEIYGYSTKVFNQQVKRNIEKFENDFMFQLTQQEITNLRSQNVTSSWGGTRYLPYAFTEQGIYMLMTVLKGEIATSQSKALIRIFKKMKDYIISNNYLLANNNSVEMNLIMQNTLDIAEMKREMLKKSDLAEIMRSFTDTKVKNEYLIYKDEVVEADLAYKDIYSQATESIYVIDNYIGLKTLYLLKDVKSNINITIFSDNVNSGLSQIEYTDFQKEFPEISIKLKRTRNQVHDRFIVIDFGTENEKIYLCGASSKDAGKRITSIVKLSDIKCYKLMICDLVAGMPELKLK